MPRKSKQPETSPELLRVYRFVRNVRDGWITADPNTSAPSDLEAITAMLDALLRGGDPKTIFGLPDGRARRSTYARDRRLAVAVASFSEKMTIDEAINEVANQTELGFETVREAYYRHKKHARALLGLQRIQNILEGGE